MKSVAQPIVKRSFQMGRYNEILATPSSNVPAYSNGHDEFNHEFPF